MLDVNFSPFPVLTTERLSLRQIDFSDAEDLFRLRSDERVMRYIDRPIAKTVEDSMELIGRISGDLVANNGITWVITLRDDNRLIGTIGHWKLMKEHYRAEVGYLLDPRHQGKGIMREALAKILDYGFKELKLHSVEANVNPANSGSIRLLEGLRFRKEAHFRENYYYNGKFMDSLVYSLLHSEVGPQ
ncbi:MAG: GNAT family N-acetyltransferase [Chitinophagaceae bacterium]|nr:GNAT family N-acetyltransferase [Chitinophagaceae bacterium]